MSKQYWDIKNPKTEKKNQPTVRDFKDYVEEEQKRHIYEVPTVDCLQHSECLHKRCSNCNGTGRSHYNGSYCVHALLCPCRSCSPVMMEYKNGMMTVVQVSSWTRIHNPFEELKSLDKLIDKERVEVG